MNWLEDLNRERTFTYREKLDSTDGDFISGTPDEIEELISQKLKFDPGETFEYQGKTFHYSGFSSIKMSLTTRVTFEKNGRKAILTKLPDGKIVARAMTKENLLNGKNVVKKAKGEASNGKDGYRIESVLTKACKEHTDKQKKLQVVSKYKSVMKNIEQQKARKK